MTYDERCSSPEMGTYSDVGLRAYYLEEAKKLEAELGFSTSNFISVPHSFFQEIGIDGALGNTQGVVDIINMSNCYDFRSANRELVEYFTNQLTPHLAALRDRAQSLGGESIIVRPSPLDEHLRPDLSFAGAYKGYMPLSSMSRDEHLLSGTAKMLAGRFTQYGNCYYARHEIETDRSVGAIYMEPFFELGKESPLFYGTAYIVGDHIRNEYHITPPPNEPQRDPYVSIQRGGRMWHSGSDQQLESSIDFTGRLTRALGGLQDHFKAPLDVEYIIDPRGDLYVVQVRKISDSHLANWAKLPLVCEEEVEHRSAIVNTVGAVEGRIIDLRSSVADITMEDLDKGILVINHELKAGGMDTRALFELLSQYGGKNLKVVIDHGNLRLRDHLQYAIAEDPGIDFILQTTDPRTIQRLRHDEYVRITSDGISANLER